MSIDHIEEVNKFNPYHGKDGRFASAGNHTSFTYAPGKSKAHDMAIAREKERQAAAGGAAGAGKEQKPQEQKAVSPTSTGGKLVDQGNGQWYGENDNGYSTSVLDGGKSDINFYRYGSKQIYEVHYNSDTKVDIRPASYVSTKAEAKSLANGYLKETKNTTQSTKQTTKPKQKQQEPEVFDMVGYLSQGMTINSSGQVVPARKSDMDTITEVNKSDIDTIEHIEKFNPYHGKDGRFSSKSGGGATAGGTGAAGAGDASSRVEEIVRGGSYSPTTVARELGIKEKEALTLIKQAQKKVGEKDGTTLGMEPGDSRVLNKDNMRENDWNNALNYAGKGSTIKTKTGAVYEKKANGNWEGEDKGFYSGKKVTVATNIDGVKAKGIVEFKYVKKSIDTIEE